MTIILTCCEPPVTLKIWFEYQPEKLSPEGITERLTLVHCEFNGKDYTSFSACRSPDAFRRDTGRRIALNRLLRHGLYTLSNDDTVIPAKTVWRRDLDFTRDMRSEVWVAYFQEHADLKAKRSEVKTTGAQASL